jgi:tetratricopeptide (TPR) repeat protein
LRLDFYDANYHALLAAVFQAQSQWRKMLEAAETGLQVDPEHVGSANLRAFALNRLNRKDEASAALETALARDPENATTHASQGWTRLHQGDTQGALHHFREALRLEPDHAWAREGIIEALKSRHFMYRLFLRYLFWMARLSPSAQWGVVMGLFIGSRLVRSLGQSIPELAPFLKPISLLYILFVFFTWTARPLFNLLLRLDKFGRLVLTPSQIVATNWIGACLLTALVSGALCFVFPEPVWFALLITSLGMVIPIAGTFRGRFDEPTLGMGLFAGVLGLLAVFTVAGAAVAGAEGASLPGGLFGVGVFAFMIASNFARGR